VLAANQGIDKAFLAAGLLWSLLRSALGSQCCVVLPWMRRGRRIFAAASLERKILAIQTAPAVLAILATLF
jgi:putative membrane protein